MARQSAAVVEMYYYRVVGDKQYIVSTHPSAEASNWDSVLGGI